MEVTFAIIVGVLISSEFLNPTVASASICYKLSDLQGIKRDQKEENRKKKYQRE